MGDASTIRIVTGESNGMVMGIESYSDCGGYESLEDALYRAQSEPYFTQSEPYLTRSEPYFARPESKYSPYFYRNIIMAHQKSMEEGAIQPFLCPMEDLFNFHNETEHPKVVIDFASKTISVEIPGIGDTETQVKVFQKVYDVLIEFDDYYDRIEEFYRTNH